MERTSVQKLAKVLKIMVIVLFAVNILALLLIPGLIFFSNDSLSGEWEGLEKGLKDFLALWNYEWDDALVNLFIFAPQFIFTTPHTAVLTIFLWACGICSAVILWQGKRVLDTILAGEPFSLANAANLKRAAVCCFVISGAALVRLVWGLFYYGSAAPLLTYNTLFIPVFLVAGLLCLVMSALFRQAAGLKAENDLTI